MADQRSDEGSSISNLSAEGSDTTVQINIKTLNSQIYSFQVDKNMVISSFKEKIATEIGLPVNQQRLIFRGKVLKDEHLLSEYHVENGNTMHLVERQPAQSQPSGGSSGEATGTNGSPGSDAYTGPPQNRIGQISHSVVLGTFNVGDQGEGAVPDLSRVIGAVLNSIGIGGQVPNLSASTLTSSTNVTGQATHGIATEGVNVGGQSQPANEAQSGQVFSSQTFQSSPQTVQIPLAAGGLPVPTLSTPIPDSLSTMSVFMNRMEQTLSQDGYQPNSFSTEPSGSHHVALPFTAQGIPTLEALSMILRQAERLLSNHAVAALSHTAGRLERDGASSDPSIRGQIQAESMQTGIAMQHLGALLLELGRTVLTLRVGQSPAESVVNAGHAVYISPSGPNPIMVQPFPLQTSSLFGNAILPTSATFGPIGNGIGSAPRNINIHIHAGAALAPIVSAIGPRPINGEGNQGENHSSSGSGDPGSIRVTPVRNVIAAAIPSLPTGVVATNAGQSELGASQQHSGSGSDSLSSVLADITSQLRNYVGDSQRESVNQAERRGQDSNSGSGTQNTSGSVQLNTMVQNGVQNSSESSPGSTSENDIEKRETMQPCNNQETMVSSSTDTSTNYSSPSVGISPMPAIAEEKAPSVGGSAVAGSAIPLGLGVGSFERKRRGKQQLQNVKSGDDGTSDMQDQHASVGVPHMLQSLANLGSAMNQTSASETSTGPSPSSVGPVDVSGVMSQVLGSPSLNGLLSGVSEQTGVGSPDVFRNMLQQFTQNPQMMNTINQVIEQVGSQDLENMAAGMDGALGGGIDFSRMLQQMMPVVSRALGGTSARSLASSAPESEPQASHSFQMPVSLRPVAQRIERLDPPADVFHSLVENAIQLSDTGDGSNNGLNQLGTDELLARDYAEILRRDLGRRFNG